MCVSKLARKSIVNGDVNPCLSIVRARCVILFLKIFPNGDSSMKQITFHLKNKKKTRISLTVKMTKYKIAVDFSKNKLT